MKNLWIDCETFSDVPITYGTHRYAEAAEVLLVAYAIGDGPVHVWDVTDGDSMPLDLEIALEEDDTLVWAHNSHFDRTVLRHALGVDIPLTRWRDIMVQALAHALPAGLGTLCDVTGVPTDKAKDKEGRQLVLMFCKPRRLPDGTSRRADRISHPGHWDRFIEYARLDVEAMREAHRRMPVWNYRGDELALWHLDQEINDRGIAIDLDLVYAAIDAVEAEKARLSARTSDLTLGMVGATTQRDALLAHLLEGYGVSLPDLQASTLERRVSDPDLPAELRELLAIRLQASSTSTAKFKTLRDGVSRDGRLRGLLQFDGASRTGRWAGRLFQPQNLSRPSVKPPMIEAGIEALKARCADLVTDNVMQLASDSIRGCIVAEPGRKIIAADLSNIEGRMLAWLAGEEWKLEAFRAFDRGQGPDLYRVAYARSFGIDADEVTGEQRQIGKTQELALGYEGGVGAFVTFATAYRIDLEAMAAAAADNLDEDLAAEARRALAWTKQQKMPRYGLSDRAWIVCDVFKRAWRYAHPRVVAFWADLESGALAAIGYPGRPFKAGRVVLQRDGAWLRVRLPSGRFLCYPGIRAEDGKITYMGLDQYTKRWQRLATYGGKLCENVTQAASRDILAQGMVNAERGGYRVVLHVHDELITENPDNDEYTVSGLARCMTRNPVWAPELPLAAAGFESYRYRKD